MDEEEAKLLSAMERCDPETLALYTYEMRKALIESALSNGVMPSIPMWHSIGDLLILMNVHPPRGTDKSEVTMQSVVKMNYRRTEHLNFIEDVENGRHKIVRYPDGKMSVLMLKYLEPIHDMFRVYGLASSGTVVNEADLFKFKDIDELVIKEVDLNLGVDMADFFDSLWPYIVTLRYGFSLYFRTSLQYRYAPAKVDIPVIMGLSYSLKPGQTFIIPKQNVARHYAKYNAYAAGRTLDQFLVDYSNSNERVPIMVSVGDRIIADRLTLLYFAIHLHGQYIEANRRNGGSDSISEMKKKAADVFEAKVRSELRKHGYAGPDSAVKVKYDYDVIGISESKKRIILADAKFRDISPSSICADTIIQQELLEPGQGVQYEAERHIQRVDFFKKNLGLFKQYLEPKANLATYELKSYLVTKHTPLVKQYKDVGVLSLEELIEQEFK
ncbi:hypothetical protein [Dehalococcoides mccartyi]|uniref:hypothetical protein n=1 Tax=Dehalococcoides mccartyi TaxID=61435 RepID=UPI0011D24A0E|nr:hypothetical protein [Dehalococcoides mccartyi]